MSRRLEVVSTDERGRESRRRVHWAWAWLFLVAFLAVLGLLFKSYDTARQQQLQALELQEQIRTLRAANTKLALLESELLELRELQQQMLRLVGVERALGVDLKLLQEMQAASADSGSNELLLWPVGGDLLQGYTQSHPAVDLGVPKGTTVVSPGDGVVIKAVGPPLDQSLYIDHLNGTTTIYRGLSMVLVDAEELVSAGQVIGLVGQGDHQPQPYLHFQVLIDDEPVRPREFIFQDAPWTVP